MYSRVPLAIGLVLFVAAFGYSQERSLRFFGTGLDDKDRVKIAIDAPHRPVDVGDDLTIEFWMKANLADNGGTVDCSSTSGGDRWITGNTIFDRDIFGAGDFGDYGISLSQGRIVFGVEAGTGSITLCGTTNAANGVWRHIAVTRQRSTGQMQIFVDGVRQAIGNGGTGDVSYRDGRVTSYPNSDPFLVIGAEKHDAGSAYPSYSGFIDEVRVSRIVRYTANFMRPGSPFNPDSNTVGLYHLNEGTGTLIGDSSFVPGGPSNGVRNVGGPNSGPAWSTDTPFGLTFVAAISGRVARANGVGEAAVRMILTNTSNNQTTEVLTNANGDYTFDTVQTGFEYTLQPRYVTLRFEPQSRSIIHTGPLTGVDFTSRRRRKWY